MRYNKATVAVIIIILFHAVGLAGFFIPALRPLFLKIAPLHILLMFAVIIYSHRYADARFLLFGCVVFGLGFAAEWAGVHQRLIFGHYAYGRTLGFKLWRIPLTIGVNWFLLIYSAGVLMRRTGMGKAARIITGAVILVLLDVLIEPVAVKFDYWHWSPHGGPLAAPPQNYAGWLIVSALLLWIFELFKFKKQSMVAVVLLVTQFVFFGLLYWGAV